MSVNLPEWLHGKEIEHDFDSYENLDQLLRSHLKSQIATLHEMWKPASRNGGAFERLPGGNTRLVERKALDWALFLLAEDYASPAGFAAALLPAIMAGVEDILIVRVGDAKTPMQPAILSVLELLGREELFALSLAESSRLAENLSEQSLYGKVISFGASFVPSARALPAQVRIGLAGASVDTNIMAWLHPSAQIEPYKPGLFYDAVITISPDFFQNYSAPLVLGPSYEYFWQWPDLSPDFFQRQSVFITRSDR